jgi:Ca-activated chloride channel family protein
MPNEIDEEVLTEIAQKTGGKYFRARSRDELSEIYDEIDQMERTEIKVKEYVQYRELFVLFVYIGLALLILEILLSQTIFRKIP